MRVLQRRPANIVDVWQADRYRRVLTSARGFALVEVVNQGTIALPRVRFRVLRRQGVARGPASIQPALRRILGLDVDPRPLRRAVQASHARRDWATSLRGMRPPRFAGLFEAFANVIPFQQVSLDAGLAVVRRLVERFGERVPHVGPPIYGFPAASTIASARLSAVRACGMSRRKAEALRHTARAIAAGDLTEQRLEGMESDEAIRFLTAQPGIGPWSAALILLRGMGRLDVFPPGDVGATRALSELLSPRSAGVLKRAIERAGLYRGYLYLCSLGSTLMAKGLIHERPVRGGRRQHD